MASCRGRRIASRPELLFVGSATFHYLGPSFAVLLFALVPPLGVAWLRIVTAAVVFAVWRRPWRAWLGAPPRERWVVVAWGVLLAGMNTVFYLAIDALPLATVAAIEFVGPVLIAAAGARSVRNGVAVVLVCCGVAALSTVSVSGSALGLGFAAANMVLFAGYIVLGHRVAGQRTLGGIDGLAAAMVVAALAALPLAPQAAPALGSATALGAGAAVGVTSSVIPYVLDQLAMRRLSRGGYAVLSALLPATATVIGLIVLHQRPMPLDLLGIALVIAAVATHQEPRQA